MSKWNSGWPVTSDRVTRKTPRRPGVDDIQLPGRTVVVVPVRRLHVEATGEREPRVPAEQGDHELVRPLRQGLPRNGRSVLVPARGVHHEAAVDASRHGPDEELG